MSGGRPATRAKKQKAQQERKERREKCRYRPEDYVQNQEPREKKLTPGIVLRHGPSARKRSGTEIDIPVAAEEEWAGLKTAAGEPEMPEAETVQEIQTEQLSGAGGVSGGDRGDDAGGALFLRGKAAAVPGGRTGYRRRKCSPGNGRRSCTTTGCP